MSGPEDLNSLASVLSGARLVLLDFDGPVCSVFAGCPPERIARTLSDELLPDVVEPPTDPLVVLRKAAGGQSHRLADAEARLEEAECTAVETASPTDGAAEFLHACRGAGRRVVIVSNNSGAAIRKYLGLHDLDRLVTAVVGRPPRRPDLMKPNPHLLVTALSLTNAWPSDAVMIGDSVSDIQAAGAAAVPAIGYANKSGKSQRLADARADAICTSMRALAEALTSTK